MELYRIRLPKADLEAGEATAKALGTSLPEYLRLSIRALVASKAFPFTPGRPADRPLEKPARKPARGRKVPSDPPAQG
jgi:hypothetical protein